MKPFKHVLLGTLALILSLSLLSCTADKEALEVSKKQEQQIADRLAPEGKVALEGETGAASVATAAAGPRSVEEIYKTKCVACHGTGAAGAPKMGVAADWESRIAQGIETVYKHAIEGIRGMPPKGLCMDCSDEELKATVDYMLESI